MARWFITVLLILLTTSCASPSPDSPEAAFEDAVQAVETGNLEKLDGLLARDFTGDHSRGQVLAYARQWFSRRPDINVVILKHEKSTSPGRVTFRSQLMVSSGSGLIPKRSSRVNVDTQWERENGRWVLRVAQVNRFR